MVVTLTKKQVAQIVAFAGAILPRKASIPALAHALFEPDGADRIKVMLTDLEQTLAISLTPGKLQGAPARFLFPVAELKTLKADMVTLQPMGEDAVVCTAASGGRSFARTVTVPPVTEFPEIVQPGELAECDLGAFLRAYRQAAFAAHPDSGRQVLHAVYADHGNRVLVGTDGHRLTRSPLSEFPFTTDAILPLNKMLLKHFAETGQGRIGLHEKDEVQTLVLATDELTYSCRCPEGRFPNYEQVIPDTDRHTASLSFGPGDREAVESLLPYLDKATQNGLFLFGKDGRAVLGIEGTGGEPVVLPLPECQCSDADGLILPVNGVFLVEALKQGFLHLRAASAYTPIVFDDGAEGLHLLMPLRGEASSALLEAAGVQPTPEATETTPEPESQPIAPTTIPSKPEEPAMPATPAPAQQPKPAAPVPSPTRNLEMVPAEDPIARLEELANESLEIVQQALATVRELKRQVRAAKTHFRTREKEIEAREREMEKSRGLIQRLQEAIAA